MVGVTGGDSAHRGYITPLMPGRERSGSSGPSRAGRKGNETWSGDSWKYGSGAAWMNHTTPSWARLLERR